MIHPNFYENLEEMHRRLGSTVVTYDGDPFQVVSITNHKSDGIFRIYLWPVQVAFKDANGVSFLQIAQTYPNQDPRLGPALDKWMEENKDSPARRKMANSPAFNKFRPFSLGMMNSNGRASFLERSPERRTQQGLIRQMVEETFLTTDNSPRRNTFQGTLGGPEFYDCVKGNHPSAEECMENMLDPSVENTAVACHRNFAIIRGPMDTFFLGYKTDVVGFIPPTKRPTVELGKKFAHLKEAVEESKQFHDIKTRG